MKHNAETNVDDAAGLTAPKVLSATEMAGQLAICGMNAIGLKSAASISACNHMFTLQLFSAGNLDKSGARPHWRHEDRGASSQCSAAAQASARPAKYRPATAQRPYKLRCHRLSPGPSTPVRCASWPGGPTLGTKASSPSASRHSRCWETYITQPVSSICLTDIAGQ